MSEEAFDVVTGAFGFSGKYLTRRLLADGRKVRTLTNSPARKHEFGARVEVHPLAFDDPDALARSLEGARSLTNTYWVRFNHATFQHASAVENTQKLFAAAKRAGVPRVVHVSITNPSLESPFEYFRGKAVLEKALVDSGLSHAIVRPAVLFGAEDILVNNIAWSLRKLPVFGLFGDGSYRLQPVHVDDFAAVLERETTGTSNLVVEGIGPESFTYRGLAETLRETLGLSTPIWGFPPRVAWLAGWAIGKLVGDVTITWEEVGGLMADLLHVDAPACGPTKLSEWAKEHRATLGAAYASELGRRLDRTRPY